MSNSRYRTLLWTLMLSAPAFAGTTGKIAGRVTDAESGEPLPGVNVIIENTTSGAATDPDGRYAVLNVPPGLYALRFSMMGYTELNVRQVRVRIDLTATIDASLTPRVLEAQETVTVVAERPLVQLDMTSALSAVGAEEISALPVQEIEDVIELQAGVVQADGLHIRGGRSGEVAYWVDGVATTDVFDGEMGVTVENSAVQELQIVSGTFNAEYGQAMSGIINIITKEGGRAFDGQIKAYAGDYIGGGEEFEVLESVGPVVDPVSGRERAASESANPLRELNPVYNLEASLSGPVPLISDRLSFFATGRYLSKEGWLYGRDWYTPQGTPGDSALVPMNPLGKLSGMAKLTLQPHSGIRLSYGLFASRLDRDRSYIHAYRYNPYGVPQQHSRGLTHLFTLNHVLSARTFYELRLSRFNSEYDQYVFEDQTAYPDYLVRVTGDTARGVYTFDPSTAGGATELERVRSERYTFFFVPDPQNADGYIHPDSARAPTSFSFYRSGMDMDHLYRTTSYWIGKLDLTSQINPSHQIKTGFEVRAHKLTLDQFTLRPKLKTGQSEQIVPFQPHVEAISTIYTMQYTRRPREFSFYLQDKMEFNEIILNLGLRYDYFDARAALPAVSEDPDIYHPIQPEFKYVNPDAALEQRIEYDPEQRRAFMQRDVDAKMQLSPRLGIAYPITDQGVIHFSYGHFFQIPEFQYLYQNPDYKIRVGGGNTLFGNPDLSPQRTVMYEIGLQQQLSRDIGMDLTLFYRDVRDWVGTSPLIPTLIPAVKYSLYENKDYSNVRGITLKLEKRPSSNFSARLDYSFQIAEGTYSDPIDAFNAYTAREEPRLALIPLDWDQNHTMNLQLTYTLSDWTCSLIGKYYSGMPYTPGFGVGEFVGGAARTGLRENSERLPNQKSVDLRLNKRIDIGPLDLSLFCYIYNLFDQKDELRVYSDTRSARTTTTIDPEQISYDPRRVGTVEDYVMQSSWFSEPRQIQAGLALEF